MAEPKKSEVDFQKAFETEQEKAGIAVHLPRAGEPGHPLTAPVDGKKKPDGK